jgi:uncharacterized protein with GYD domain
MAHYLFQGTYTPEAWANLVKKPQNRLEVVRPAVEKLGGKILGYWFAFGDYDVVTVIEMPDNVSAAAIAIVFASGGLLKASKTTSLMTVEEGLKALKLAATSGYRAAA